LAVAVEGEGAKKEEVSSSRLITQVHLKAVSAANASSCDLDAAL
jgi:hypothetical protein